MSDELFPVEAVQQDSPRLLWIRKHDIKTHRSDNVPESESWMALMPQEKDRNRELADIMAESCRLYDECGHIGYGATEDDAIAELARNVGLRLWFEEAP